LRVFSSTRSCVAIRGVGEMPRLDETIRVDLEEERRADRHLQRDRVDALRALDEVQRRVHVGAGVRAELQARDVRGITALRRGRRADGDAGIAFVDDHPFTNRQRDVDERHAYGTSVR